MDDAVISCSRTGCDRRAVASFSFDALAALVWLDTVVASRGAGMLCELHADRLTPPRGWNLQDRRARSPRLWVDRPAAGSPTRPARRPRAVRVRPCTAAAAPNLPFETVTITTPEPTSPRHWSPRDLPVLDDVFDARTPLLARAFEATRGPGRSGVDRTGADRTGADQTGADQTGAPSAARRADTGPSA